MIMNNGQEKIYPPIPHYLLGLVLLETILPLLVTLGKAIWVGYISSATLKYTMGSPLYIGFIIFWHGALISSYFSVVKKIKAYDGSEESIKTVNGVTRKWLSFTMIEGILFPFFPQL